MKNKKNYKSILLYLGSASLLLCNSMKAQTMNFEWAKRIGNDVNNPITLFDKSSVSDLKVDFNGDVYQTGIFAGTVDFDPGIGVFNLTSNGAADIFDMYILKLNNQGNLLWVKRFTGSGYDRPITLCTDETGNVIVSGYFGGVTDFDPGEGTFNMTTLPISFDKANSFILKLDGLGNFIWAKKIKGNDLNGPSEVVTDNLGNVYVTGLFQGTTDFNPGSGINNLVGGSEGNFFILKVNSEGQFIWVKELVGPFYSNLDFDLFGNIYVCGKYSETIDFDPGDAVYNLTSAGSSDIFILKLNPTGEFIWVKSLGGNSTDEFRSLNVDGFGSIYTTGRYKGTADFDPSESTFNLISSGSGVSYDIFISKLNADGNFEWAKSFGNNTFDEEVTSLKAYQTGNIYLVGWFRGTVDFDPNTDQFNLTSKGIDSYILKLNSNGDFQWVGKLGGNSSNDFAVTLDIDSFENVYTTGIFSKTGDFDPSIGKSKLTATGEYDIFIQKMSQDAQENNLKTFQDETISSSKIIKKVFNVFPNPAKGSFAINTDLENYNIELRDVTGKLVYTQNNINQTVFNLDIKDIEAGTYFVTINNANSSEVIKLMIY